MNQCKTAAQCLKELARVMEQFGLPRVKDALASEYIKSDGSKYVDLVYPGFVEPKIWSFAIAEVEGKPVFVDSILFNQDYLNGLTGEKISHLYNMSGFKSFTWNPPKPKTIMVELLVEDAKAIAALNAEGFSQAARIEEACAKALEREGVK